MTNEELVRRLRIGVLGYGEAAAARIEELEESLKARTAERNYANDVTDAAIGEVNALKVKLAKAVDTLMFYGGVMPNAFLPIQDGGEKARATLDDMHRESQ